MQVQFTARHMELTEAIKEYTTAKLTKLQRYMDLIVEAYVTLSVEKYRHSVEIRLKGKKGFVSGAEVSDDMYLSIDRVFDKIEKQLRRRKDRKVDQKRTIRSDEIAPPVDLSAPEDQFSVDNSIDASTIVKNEIGDNIIETEVELMKSMGFEEALMEFKLRNQEFYVFQNADQGNNLSVLYRLNDGRFGHVLAKK